MPAKTEERPAPAARQTATREESEPRMKWNRKTGIIAAGAAAIVGLGAALFVRRRWRRDDEERPAPAHARNRREPGHAGDSGAARGADRRFGSGLAGRARPLRMGRRGAVALAVLRSAVVARAAAHAAACLLGVALVLPCWDARASSENYIRSFLRDHMGFSAGEVQSVFQGKATAYLAKLKGDTLAERARKFARMRDQEGHMAEFTSSGGLRIVEHHSPMLDLMRAFPIIARLEGDLYQRVLETVVTREEQLTAGPYQCVFHITVR